MTTLTLSGQPIALDAVWHHYVDQRRSPLQYCLVIDQQETGQLACVARYAGCAVDDSQLAARILSQDAERRSTGLLWELQRVWKAAGLVPEGTKTPIIHCLHNITRASWDRKRLTIEGGAATAVAGQ